MVQDNQKNDAELEEFNALLRQATPVLASPELKARVLAAADTPGKTTSIGSVLHQLWPFGSLWRPAAGLAAAACFGVVVGLIGPAGIGGSIAQDTLPTGLGEDVLSIASVLTTGEDQADDF